MNAVTGSFGGSTLALAGSTDSKFVLDAFRAVVGPKGMRDLREEKGGTEIWVPRECDAGHWMSRLFGEDKANAICERINVIDADGRVVGNMRCYVPREYSRVDELKDQIEEEIKQGLLAGKRVRDIAREVRVSEAAVFSHQRRLRAKGVIPERKKALAVTKLEKRSEHQQARALKIARVDKLLLAGKTNKRVALESKTGVTFIRQRRKVLVAAGKLRAGPKTSLYSPALDGDFSGALHLPIRKSSHFEKDDTEAGGD